MNKIVFLTAAAVLGIAFTPLPTPSLKKDEKCYQKAELGFAECNFLNSDKKYSAYGMRTKNCFCCKKAEMNFTQSNFKNMDKQQSAYGVLSKFLKDYMLLPLPYTQLIFACRCHETSLTPVLLGFRNRQKIMIREIK